LKRKAVLGERRGIAGLSGQKGNSGGKSRQWAPTDWAREQNSRERPLLLRGKGEPSEKEIFLGP